jgi:hypothetical protein
VGAFLLGRPPAIAVGKAVTHTGKVVLDPFRAGSGPVGVECQELAAGVDPLGLVGVKGVTDGVVVDAMGQSDIGTVGVAVDGGSGGKGG